jgi:hypothetical protein
VYHFAAKEQNESVRLSEDYFIEARLDNAPTVKITHLVRRSGQPD